VRRANGLPDQAGAAEGQSTLAAVSSAKTGKEKKAAFSLPVKGENTLKNKKML
jgi:hypothetical protein